MNPRRDRQEPADIMRRIRPKLNEGYQADILISTNVIRVHAETSVDLLVARREEDGPYVLNTSLAECASSLENPEQCVAYYLSVLGCIFPGFTTLAKEFFAERGYGVNEITRDQFGNHEITVRDWINIPTCAVVFGQLVLIMFKNIRPINYVQFFQVRTLAMKAEAGCHGDLSPDGGDVLLSLEIAEAINKSVGRAAKLRSGVLKVLLHNRDTQTIIGNICNYLCEILSWCEMSGVVWILDHLCMTRSCILQDSRIQHEVLNFYDACLLISEKQHSQYYRIFHPHEAMRTISKSRFPILLEVARRIKMAQTTTATQFQQSVTENISPLVAELKTNHDNHMIIHSQTRLNNVLNHLVHFDIPDQQVPVTERQEDGQT